MNRYFERLWQLLAQGDDNGIDEGTRSRGGAGQEQGNDPAGPAPGLQSAAEWAGRTLPVIWLLGKTGAGKSSLIQALTGLSAARVGNGFEPCTRTASMLDFPHDLPVMRFLDTRGLGETGYDPEEDLHACDKGSHVLIAVARLDDPVQAEIAAAIAAVRKRRSGTPIIIVHNGADLLPQEQARFRARAQTQQLFEKAAGQTLPSIETILLPGQVPASESGVDSLITHLAGIMPDVALLLAGEERRDAERNAFADVRARVLWYASAAGASDVAPVVGAVTVPSLQAAMLRTLGKIYEVSWTRVRMTEFTLALGASAAFRFGASYAVRQLTKLIPVYGQTAGAAVSGTISFAATYALGRAAAFYLHRTQLGLAIDPEELRALYTDALRRARREGT
ncbi:YcjF family protein [Pseudohongiella acticola]|uniref:YcjF family protein n=1 Tax=Pseudohongiella acticola TaxID=1524254 RepID=UPI000B261C1F|nr:GTPase [Pseudohongiella acticola]